MGESAGAVESIWRFPIKSFQGESLERTTLSESGIYADRVFALRSAETGKILSGKHARLGERILEFDCWFVEEPVEGQPLPAIGARIDGRDLPLAEAAVFVASCSEACSTALGHPVELVAAGANTEIYETFWPEIEDLPIAGATIDFPLPLAEQGSFADLEPIHLLTTASLRLLASLVPDSEINVSRFRPSFVIDTGLTTGFVENDWVGRKAKLGEASLEFGAASPRCIMTTRAQAGLPRDPSVLRALVQENRHEFMGLMMPCLGLYAKVTRPGAVGVGDALVLE